MARGGRARPRARRLAAVARRPLPPPVPARRAARRRVGRGHAGDRGAVVRRWAPSTPPCARRCSEPPAALGFARRGRSATSRTPTATARRSTSRSSGRSAAARELAQWGALKGAATEALLAAGGTLSHHHGVGTIHAPYLEREVGPRRAWRRCAALGARARPARRPQPRCLLPEPEPRAPNPGWGRGSVPPRLARARLARLGERLDLLVIGGGITGAGILHDAALRGLAVGLVERGDFGCGTSSRSSKLIHGGLRYLRRMQLGITRTACRERDLLALLHPHLVRPDALPLPVVRARRHAGVAGRTSASSMYDHLTPVRHRHERVDAAEARRAGAAAGARRASSSACSTTTRSPTTRAWCSRR